MMLRHLAFAVPVFMISPLLHAASFDVKTGSWEVTVTYAVSGNLIPKAEFDKMPPAQRAKMEAMMAGLAGKHKPRVITSCVTKQDLERGHLMKSDDANCKNKVIAQTSSRYEMEEVCTGPEPSKSHMKFEAKSDKSYAGVMDRTQGAGGTMHSEMTGRWLGAVCKKGDE